MARCRRVFLPSMVLTLKLIMSLYTVQGFKCHVAMEPISLTGDNTHSVNFTWSCTLMSNETELSVMWSKEDTCIAKAINGDFTPCENYIGRVEMVGTFGISLHNISRNDSGHYKIIILLNGNISECSCCQSIYMLVLMQQHHEAKAQPWEGGPSKLDIGLICGLVPVTIIGLVLGLLCFYRRRPGTRQTGNDRTTPDQMEMLQAPFGKE